MKFQMIYQLTGLSYKGGLQSKKTFSEVSLHWPHDLDRILKLISRIAKSITWIPILFRFAEEYYLINPDLHPMSAKGRPWWTGWARRKKKQLTKQFVKTRGNWGIHKRTFHGYYWRDMAVWVNVFTYCYLKGYYIGNGYFQRLLCCIATKICFCNKSSHKLTKVLGATLPPVGCVF